MLRLAGLWLALAARSTASALPVVAVPVAVSSAAVATSARDLWQKHALGWLLALEAAKLAGPSKPATARHAWENLPQAPCNDHEE